jgi:hypothetical protein
MTNEIAVIIARTSRFQAPSGEGIFVTFDEPLIIERFTNIRDPHAPAPLIVRIFSAVNIYVIYGRFNEAHVIPITVISITPRGCSALRVYYAGAITTVLTRAYDAID